MAAMGQQGGMPTLADVLASDRVELQGVPLQGVQLDSRRVRPGDVFLALPGDVHDGRQFIEQAVADGAAAVIAEAPVSGFVDEITVPLVEVPDLQQEVGAIAGRFYANPSQAMHTIGVTGTNGKTTTSQLIGQLLRGAGKHCGVIGTLGCTLDGEVVAASNTTPDAVSLQAQFAQWRDQGVGAVSMEVSSHALIQGRVNGILFETAVFTNLSQDHLDYHGSMDAYGRAKLKLFSMPGVRHAVVNLDDDFAPQVLSGIPPEVRILTYSARGAAAADVAMEDVRFHDAGVSARLRSPWGGGACESPLRGEFNLSNLLAALIPCLLAGEALDELLAAVPGLVPVAGRMQMIPNELSVQAVVDYAHTPDALAQAISALRPHVSGRVITVFGCGGDRDRSKRSVMGRLACELSDRVIVTSDNPRSENPDAILRDIASGCTGEYHLLVDRAEAIAAAVSEAQPGDCILVAGKGHEDYQITDGETRFFSDEQQLRLALAGRSSA